MICYQSTNKPVWVRGLPAPVNRSPLNRSAHLVYVLITLGAFPRDFLSGKLPKPVLLSYGLLIYISDLRWSLSALRALSVSSNNTIFLTLQTLHNNKMSSLFSHRTISQVLLLPFIHYHIVFISTSLLIYNIHFSVGNSYNLNYKSNITQISYYCFIRLLSLES